MRNYEIPVSGKVLRGGKGLIARTNKATIFVRDKGAYDKAVKMYGKRVKIELFPNLEDMI